MIEKTTPYTLAIILFFLVVPAAAQEVKETKEETTPEIETE